MPVKFATAVQSRVVNSEALRRARLEERFYEAKRRVAAAWEKWRQRK